MASKYILLKKLSVKSVCGKPTAPVGKETKWLLEVFGVATDIKRGTTDKGDWYAFVGAFQALNMETGAVYRSGVLFVPDIVGNLILPKITAEETNSVEFGFRIGVGADDSSATGYVYHAEPLLPVDENDPVELLSRKLSEVKALSAPEVKTDKKKEEKAKA